MRVFVGRVRTIASALLSRARWFWRGCTNFTIRIGSGLVRWLRGELGSWRTWLFKIWQKVVERLRSLLATLPRWLATVSEGWSKHLGLRLLFVTTPGRIGHEQFELDTYFREMHGGGTDEVPKHHILFFPRGKSSNHEALLQWSSQLTLWELSPVVYDWLKSVLFEAPFRGQTKWTWDFFPYGCYLDQRAEAYEIFTRYGSRPAFLKLSDRQIDEGRRGLEKLGLDRNQWFVCVHCRSAGYSTWDDHLHSYRNSPVENYVSAMREVVSRGGVCFRMGGPEMPPLPAIDGVIDYAHSSMRSEFMDLFLSGSCRFFLGSSSGLFMLSQALGRPCALADMSPIGAAAFGVRDLFLPKLVRNKDGDLLSFAEAFGQECSSFRFTTQYEDAGLEVVDNKPEEIRGLAKDMFDFLERGDEAFSGDDWRLQERYQSLFEFHHYGHGHGSRIAPSFIRKYQAMLPRN